MRSGAVGGVEISNISWQEYFMAIAYLSGLRSKDLSAQGGAALVDSKKRVVGIGYDGLPSGILGKKNTIGSKYGYNAAGSSSRRVFLDTKYPY